MIEAKRDMLSIVVPLYNEEAVIPMLRRRLLEWRETLGLRVECILVNDGSKDGTEALLDAFAHEESDVKVVHLIDVGPLAVEVSHFDSSEVRS